MEATLGIELRTMRTIRDAALLFIRLGVQHAVVSMGAMGAMYISAEKTLFAPALRVSAKSTVGAGDAMIAGFLAGYLDSRGEYLYAFKKGMCAGAAKAFNLAMTSRKEIDYLMRTADFDIEESRI